VDHRVFETDTDLVRGGKGIEGGSGSFPLFCIHPPKDFTKATKDNWRIGLKDLIRWITRGHDHIYGGLLSGGLIPEGEGAPEEEAPQIGTRKDELYVATIESVETGWSFLQDLGTPEEKRKKIHVSWEKCLRDIFTPMEGRRNRWSG
jgi:hypothetical protein